MLFDRRLSPDSSALLVSEPVQDKGVAILLACFVEVAIFGMGDRLEATDMSAPELIADCPEISEDETGGEWQDVLEEGENDDGEDIGTIPPKDPPGFGHT